MIANYHTHTPRCRHAKGSEREYVESAIKAGLQVLGYADHSPQIFPAGYDSTFRMYP
jgi:histidinol-phosphatase (PHP family)